MITPAPGDNLQAAEREVERLRRLIAASKLVNSSIEGESLYRSILSVACDELDVERGTLYFVDQERRRLSARIAPEGDLHEIHLELGQGLAGTVAATGDSIIINDAYTDPRFDRSADQRSGFRTRSMLCAAIRNRRGTVVGVLQLLNKRSGIFGGPDLDFLEALGEHMAIAIENARLHVEMLTKDRMQRELSLGRDVQSRLLPATPRDVPGVAVAARYLSCYEVSGDFYDFFPLPEGLGIALGDVSGKGVAAALVSASLQAAVRMAAPQEPDLARLFTRLNTLLYGMTQARKYVTFFLGRFDTRSHVLTYVNAGHLPGVVLSEGKVSRLESTGRPLGLLPAGDWQQRAVVLPNGATLVLFSDGFTEAMNVAGEEFGDQRWADLLVSLHSQPLDPICDEILSAVHRFEDGCAPTDDKTLVVLRSVA